jgi:hypothetical protein
MTHHLGTEAVVAAEDVAYSGYKDVGRGVHPIGVTCGESSDTAWHPG